MRELVILMGINAAGKSTLVEGFVKDGFARLNRDVSGGSIDDLATAADIMLSKGHIHKIILDNTYPTIQSRKSILAVGKKYKVPVRCVWLTTSLEEAQMNACLRMVRKEGRLLGPEDFKTTKDPNLFPPAALFHYRKAFQPPTKAEGFAAIEEVKFVRKWSAEYKNKAIILDADGTVRTSNGPKEWPEDVSHVKVLPNRREVLKKYELNGYILIGASNQSCISKGLPEATAQACFMETNRQLDIRIPWGYCPHRIPPISCYCRKPHAGMGALYIESLKLNPAECVMVGDQTTDKTFAERCGFQFKFAEEFFR